MPHSLRTITFVSAAVTLAIVPACHDGDRVPTAPREFAPAVGARPTIVSGTSIRLGTLGGLRTLAYGVNDAGQVVGLSDLADGGSHAFLWTANGGMQDLGTLGGTSAAVAINSMGQVVGTFYTGAFANQHAFLWTAAGGMQDIGGLGGEGNIAHGINDAGQVVGVSAYISGSTSPGHAFLWSAGGGIRDLGTLGGSQSYANDINRLGQVVGWADVGGGGRHAFLWTADGGMQNLGTLGGTTSEAQDINDAGQVVGYSEVSGGVRHAFLWTAADGMRDLGTLGGTVSEAYHINETGQVVGWSRTTGNVSYHAFLWTATDGMEDLYPRTGMFRARANNNLRLVIGDDVIATVQFQANQAPVAHDVSVTTGLGVPVAVTLAGTDPDGNALTYAIETSPGHGTLSGVAPTLTYTPTTDYVGPDAVTYRVSDDHGLRSDLATVSINVTPPGYTSTGSDVVVIPPLQGSTDPGPVTLSFSSVNGDGTTTVTSQPVTDGGAVAPSSREFRFGNPAVYYDVQTTASYTPPITICISWAQGDHGTDAQEANLKLWHWDGSGWQDVTAPGYPDVVNNVVCGTTASLSPFLVAEANAAPIVRAVALPPAPISVGSAAQVTASFSDKNLGDTHTGIVTWGDANTSAGVISEVGGSGAVSANHVYAAASVYAVNVAVSDGDLQGSRTSTLDVPAYIVVYDPSAGSVTGGGWIWSPVNACDASLCGYTGEGKASFGFVAKYVAGRTSPEGNTRFQFHSGGLDFQSTNYETLVVSGNRAQFWGTGTINGATGYTFRLTAVDGQTFGNDGTVDKFRMEIWASPGGALSSGALVYDNQRGAAQTDALTATLGGGSITIRK